MVQHCYSMTLARIMEWEARLKIMQCRTIHVPVHADHSHAYRRPAPH